MERKLFRCVSLLTVIFVVACTGEPRPSVRLNLQLNLESRGDSLSSMACFGVLVTGEDIPSRDGLDGLRLSGDHCTYPAPSSNFVALSGPGFLDVLVPPGRNRLVQVVGLELGTETKCPGERVGRFFERSRANEPGVANYGGLFEVGRALVTDLSRGKTVTIDNAYTSASPKNLRSCVLGGGLGLSLPSNRIQKDGFMLVQGTGGTPPYFYSLVNSNSGNSTYNATSGVYRAGLTSGTDLLRVTDSVGSSSSRLVTVFSPVNVPDLWFVADRFFGTSNGTNLSSSTAWTNLGTASSSPVLTVSAGAATYLNAGAGAGAGNFPAVRLSGDAVFLGTTGLGSFAAAHALVVMKPRSDTAGTVFCVSVSGNCDALSSFSLRALSGLFAKVVDFPSFFASSTATASESYQVVEVKTDLVSSSVEMGLGGINYSSSRAGLVALTGSYFALGPVDSITSNHAEIAEVIVYSRMLNALERGQWAAYFLGKYGVVL
jgi:hypothetical protein